MDRMERFAPADGTELCMYQVSTLQALAMGYNKAVITVEELLRHGDTGLGTFEGVDGEMIVVDGVCFRATADGSVTEAPPEMGVPFCAVSRLRGVRKFPLESVTNIDALKTILTQRIEEDFGLNSMHMVQFYDIAQDSPYYDALSWAVSNAVTLGRDDGTFGADELCTRGQLLTFLWRMAGMPLTDASLSFADVGEDSFYAPAVRWALSRGMIDNGMKFSPDIAITAGELDKWLSSLRPAFTSSLSGEVTRGDVMNVLFRFAQTNG